MMDNFEKDWKKHFERQIGQGSKVPTPRPEVFHAIEEKLFPKKKRKYKVLFWLLGISGLFLITTLSFYLWPSTITSDDGASVFPSVLSNENTSEMELAANRLVPLEESEVEESHPKKNLTVLNKNNKAQSILSRSSSTEYSVIKGTFMNENVNASGDGYIIKFANDPKAAEVEINEASFVPKPMNPNSSDFILTNERDLATSLKTDDKLLLTQARSPKTLRENSSQGVKEIVFKHPQSLESNIELLDKLAKIKLMSLKYEVANPSMNTFSKIEVHRQLTKPGWSISSTGYYIVWNDWLNTSFSSALNPADFYKERKSGFGVSLSATKPMSKRLGLRLAASFQRIQSVSGHSSNVTYSLSGEENPMENVHNMTLGTPYGLLQSKVTFNRVNDIVDDQDLLIDVISDHSFWVYSISPSMEYRLFSSPSWGINISVGPSYAFLGSITNDVQLRVQNTSDIMVGRNQRIKDQQGVKSGFLAGIGQVDISCRINHQLALSASASYQVGLTPIFESGSWKSYADAAGFGLGLQWSFP